ncbi:hypothetical protein [Sutcliffiella halmapala]|uniref:hypothetical protein n=1 Tax=Sutcliffiella halmapala TaxID=79882 RepID=UPI000994A362|nr:hypothetical protein [Sutcliffiella halmapala]
MSLYYEYKSCCGKKDDRRERAADVDREKDCFCGKFLNRFLGDDVDIVTVSGAPISGILACIDDKTGILTVVGDDGPVYVCCSRIETISPATDES